MTTTRLYSINRLATLVCLLGLSLSIYSYVVELQHKNDANYKAFCDFNEHMSCTKVFGSKYGKGFGGIFTKLFGEDSLPDKPNSLFGVLMYSLLTTLSLSNSVLIAKLSLFCIILANLASLYFAYILYFVLHDLCIVCVSIYVINFCSLLLTKMKIKEIKKINSLDSKKKIK